MPKPQPTKDKRAAPADDSCTVPPALPLDQLHKLQFRTSANEVQNIRDYVEWQAPDEKVLHAEKVAGERVLGRDYDVWDVHTDKERWWVVTSPTNLYSQKLMPSMDYILSFHIGVMARVAARRTPEGSDAEQEFLLVTNRKLVQAGEALDAADEAEEFQAVGMRCRECLVALIRELTDSSDLAEGDDLPKKSDFKGWADRIANAIAAGGSAEHVRGYLKSLADKFIREEPGTALGVKALKGYMRFAKSGITAQPEISPGAEPSNEHEFAVGNVLKSNGYDVVPQVGVSGYFIDLAVRHPQKPGAWLLGVEFDGKSYHSGRSARDRDRLRQMALESQGWKIHRIWSTDWFKNRNGEIERLLSRVRSLENQ